MTENSDSNSDRWPLSNNPILGAILLLIASALSLALGRSESYANQLAIYAYYFLVIGVVIRIVEMTLPDSAIDKVNSWLSKTWERIPTEGNHASSLPPLVKEVLVYVAIIFLVFAAYMIFTRI